MFVPVSEATAAAKWSFTEAADRYEKWMDRVLRPVDSRPGVHTNQWISNHWTAKSEKLVYMNTRGPACFDFEYYLEVRKERKTTIFFIFFIFLVEWWWLPALYLVVTSACLLG